MHRYRPEEAAAPPTGRGGGGGVATKQHYKINYFFKNFLKLLFPTVYQLRQHLYVALVAHKMV